MEELRLEKVNFDYDSKKNKEHLFAFQKLNVDVGDIVSVVGKSGSGKSTLIKLISGFLKPSNKDAIISWRNQRILQPYSPVKVVFQEYSHAIFDLLTVKKNIWLGEKCSNTHSTFDYETVIDTLGLKEIENKLASDLSGGQKQRVQLARILMTQPELIILDEPDSSLDIETKNTLIKFIVDSHNSNNHKLTWILVTHDLDIATWISSKIFLINNEPSSNNAIELQGFNRLEDIKSAKGKTEFNDLVNSIKDKLRITF